MAAGYHDDAKIKTRVTRVLDELFSKVLEWDGAITGEHGIGIAKQRWWNQAVPVANRRLHAALKAAIDPRGVVNPDKFVK
jgi:glycolate oxidase